MLRKRQQSLTSGTKRHRDALSKPAVGAVDPEPLAARRADGDHEPPTLRELLEERRGHLRGGRRDDDRVERRLLRQAARPVADMHADTGAGERGARPFRELGQHRGLVARARADVEHALVAVQVARLADQPHHRRLRDRLLVADRKRDVVPRVRAQVFRDEARAVDARERVSDARAHRSARARPASRR